MSMITLGQSAICRLEDRNAHIVKARRVFSDDHMFTKEDVTSLRDWIPEEAFGEDSDNRIKYGKAQ